MIVSFLLSATPPTALTVGGIITAVGLLFLVVKLSAGAPHRRALVGVALGLAMVSVTLLWNEVLAGGLAFLRVEEDLLLTASEGADFLTDLRASGLIIMISFVAVALVTGLLSVALTLLVGLVSRGSHGQPAAPDGQAPAPHPQTQPFPNDGPHPILHADPLLPPRPAR